MNNMDYILKLIDNKNLILARLIINQSFLNKPQLYHYYMGLCYCRESLNIKALESFREALRAGLDDYMLHYNIGTVLIELRRYKEAVNSFLKAIELRGDNEDCYINLAYAYLKEDDLKGAYRSIKWGEACCRGDKLKDIENKMFSIISSEII